MKGIRLPLKTSKISTNRIRDNNDFYFCTTACKEDTEYIVTACNAYPELSTKVAELVDDNVRLEKKVKELEEIIEKARTKDECT